MKVVGVIEVYLDFFEYVKEVELRLGGISVSWLEWDYCCWGLEGIRYCVWFDG